MVPGWDKAESERVLYRLHALVRELASNDPDKRGKEGEEHNNRHIEAASGTCAKTQPLFSTADAAE